MTTATAVDARSCGLATLAFAHRFTESLLDGIPADKLTWQPFVGANHVLWNIGHLAWTDDYFLTSIGGQPSGLPDSWPALFGMKSEPVDDPGKYPSYDEVMRVFNERREALTAWFQGLDDATLFEPLPEELRSFAENRAVMISSLAAHECMHNGQIICVRKGLGLARKFG